MKRRSFLVAGLQLSAVLSVGFSRTGTTMFSLDGKPVAQEDSLLEKLFKNPPADAQPYVLWHWMNGVITKDGITADLQSFRRAGLQGVQLFLVGGSEAKIDNPENAILTDKWRELFKHAVNECARLGLKFGTHNSPGWSSTGYKSISPQDAMQKIVFSETKVDGDKQVNQLLQQPEINHFYYEDIVCLAVKDEPIIKLAEVVDVTSYLGKDSRLTWKVPEGKWIVIRIGHTPIGKVNLTAPESGQGLEVDKLDPAPLRRYWESFPSELIALAGEHAGKTFNKFEIDSYEMGNQDWTGVLAKEFKARKGYDILPYLITVSEKRIIESEEVTQRFKYDWREVVRELFQENYYGTMKSLINEVPGMELLLEPYATGHFQPFESNNAGRYADIAMCEFWQKPTPWGWDSVKPTVSGVHTWGKNIVAAEAFTGQPNSAWKVDPYKLKSTGDRAFAGGVNMLYFHTAAHQPWKNVSPGMTMGQWGTHFGRPQTWWENGGHEWIAYLTRSQFLLQQGLPVADLLYLVYDRVTPKEIPGFYAETIGTDAFLTRLTVKDKKLVLPNGIAYKMLILPDTDLMLPHIAHKVKELVLKGAIVMGPQPRRSPSLSDIGCGDAEVAAIGAALWQSGETGEGKVFMHQSIRDLLDSLTIMPDCEVQSPNSAADILWIHRRTSEADIYFLSNQSEDSVRANVLIEDNGRLPELWSAYDGRTDRVPFYQKKDGRLSVVLEFEPSGSMFLILDRNRNEIPHIQKIDSMEKPITSVRQTKGNRLLFATSMSCILTLSDNSTKKIDVKNIPAPVDLRSNWDLKFSDSSLANRKLDELISWTAFSDEARYFSGTATYSTEFDFSAKTYRKDVKYLLDLGVVHNTAQISLNGKELATLWKPPFQIDISAELKKGTNILEVQVTNLWANRLIGDEQFPDDLEWEGNSLKEIPSWIMDETERPETRRQTFTTYKFFKKDSPLLPSGLLGPVSIQIAKEVQI